LSGRKFIEESGRGDMTKRAKKLGLRTRGRQGRQKNHEVGGGIR